MRNSGLAAFALAVGLGAAATLPFGKRQAATPTIVPSAGSFVFDFCAVEPFYNGIEARTLHGASQINGNMTVELCAAYCSGYYYFGVEYANECYCGNKLRQGTTLDNVGGCNTACQGDGTEYCVSHCSPKPE